MPLGTERNRRLGVKLFQTSSAAASASAPSKPTIKHQHDDTLSQVIYRSSQCITKAINLEAAKQSIVSLVILNRPQPYQSIHNIHRINHPKNNHESASPSRHHGFPLRHRNRLYLHGHPRFHGSTKWSQQIQNYALVPCLCTVHTHRLRRRHIHQHLHGTSHGHVCQ